MQTDRLDDHALRRTGREGRETHIKDMLRDETKMQRPPAQRLVRILRRRRSDWPLGLGQARKIQVVVGVRGGHAEYVSALSAP